MLCFKASMLCFTPSMLCSEASMLCFTPSMLCFEASMLCFKASMLCFEASMLCFTPSMLCSEASMLCFTPFLLCFEACGVRTRSLSGLAIEVGLDSGPVLIAPGLFGLGDQVLRNAAMRQHELRPTICCWRQRDRGHREDALGECAVAPG